MSDCKYNIDAKQYNPDLSLKIFLILKSKITHLLMGLDSIKNWQMGFYIPNDDDKYRR